MAEDNEKVIELKVGNTEFENEILHDNLKNRRIMLNYDIDGTIVEEVSMNIVKWNIEDANLPVEERKPIWLYVDSLGGEVIEGLALCSVIKSSITPIYGVVFSTACSMAFTIILCCHKRYAFKNSVLLMHDGQQGIQASGSKFKDTVKFYNEIDKRVKELIVSNSKITSKYYDDVYEREVYMYADEEGKRFGIIDYIIGEDVDISVLH